MFRKFFEAEEGFTLIELLVTIAILAVLFGIVTLTLTGVGDNATDSLKIAECAVVQSAADIFMAANPGVSPGSRVEGSAAIIDSTEANFADAYIRDLPTTYTYWWETNGDVHCPDAEAIP